MPLPLIPALLGGAVLLTGGPGLKKGLDARENFEKAERLIDEARRIYTEDVQCWEIGHAGALRPGMAAWFFLGAALRERGPVR